jgi:hypothetical protein
MFWVSIGAHVFSGLLMAVIARCSGGTVGYYFSGFYVLSMAFRPGLEWYRYLAARLSQISGEVHYPRDDVLTLLATVQRLEATAQHHEARLETLENGLTEAAATSSLRFDTLDRRLSGLSRKFEETLDRLTDNKEIISGVKAFLRLIRQEGEVGHD